MPNNTDSKYPGHHVLIAPAVIMIFMVWAVIHTARKYSESDFFRYSLYTSLAIAAIFGAAIFSHWKEHKGPFFERPIVEDVVPLVRTLIALPLGGAVYFSVGASLIDVFFWLRSTLPIGQFTALLTLPVGLLLFYFRLKLRAFYGLTEALVGMAVAAQRASDIGVIALDNRNFYLAILTAGIYLVVRGLDNIHQGLTKPHLDPLAAKLIARFKSKSRSNGEGQNQTTEHDVAGKPPE
jgi:hypothetical protein